MSQIIQYAVSIQISSVFSIFVIVRHDRNEALTLRFIDLSLKSFSTYTFPFPFTHLSFPMYFQRKYFPVVGFPIVDERF